jgi:predicted AAA+ superfamily ATPase
MAYVHRRLEAVLARAARAFPAIVLTGPRRAGKTTLLRHLFPGASYRLLEDPAVIAALRADPRSFLDSLELRAILDEIQNAPEIQQVNAGRRREIYFFRDQRGLEVDFLVPARSRKLVLLEAEASQTVYPSAASSMLSLAASIGTAGTRCIVVHAGKESDAGKALMPGAQTMDIHSMLNALKR